MRRRDDRPLEASGPSRSTGPDVSCPGGPGRPTRSPAELRLAGLALAAALAAGCGDGAPDVAPGELSGPDIALAVPLEDVYRVGSLDGDDWELFSRVSRVAFDGAGNLYVYDAQSSRITVVDAAGRHLRTIGSAGDGPGEFRMVMGVAVFDDGSLVVQDLGHRALLRFGPDGTYQGDVETDLSDLMPGSDMLPHPAGGVVSAGGIQIRMGGPAAGPPEPPTTRPVTFFALDGSGPRTVYDAWLMPPPAAQSQSVSVEGGDFQMAAPPMVAWEPELLVGVFPDGALAVVDSTGYRIRIVASDGRVLETLERGIAPRVPTEGDREAERELQLEQLTGPNAPQVRMITDGHGGGGGPPADFGRRLMEQRIEGMLFADEIPVVAGLAVDRAGRMWVERSGRRIGERGPTDLIARDGTYLGTIAPDGTRTPDAFGPDGLVAYVEHDDMDVPSVVVRRLPAELR